MRGPARFASAMVLFLLIWAPVWSAADDPIGGKTLKEWLKELKNPDPHARENAIRMVTQYGKDAREAVPAFLNLLKDEDVGVATFAAVGLRTLGADPKDKDFQTIVTNLGAFLQKGSSLGRVHATLTLAQLGPDAKAGIKPVIEHALKANYSWELRKAGALALGRLAYDKTNGPDSAAIKALTGALKDGCAQVRLQAIQSLGILGAPRSPTELGTEQFALNLIVRNDSDPIVILWARVLLSQLDKTKAEEHANYIALRLQKGTDAQIRANAAQALGTLGPVAKSKIPELIEALRDKEAIVVTQASAALGQNKENLSNRQVDSIGKMLEESDVQVRAYAIQTLGLLGIRSRSLVPQLTAMLKDKDSVVGSAAAAALAQIAADLTQAKDSLSEAELGAIAKLLTDPEIPARCQAAQALGLIGSKAKARVPELIQALKDKEIVVIISAIVALGLMGKDADRAIPALTELKSHKDESVKDAATHALEAIVPPKPKK